MAFDLLNVLLDFSPYFSYAMSEWLLCEGISTSLNMSPCNPFFYPFNCDSKLVLAVLGMKKCSKCSVRHLPKYLQPVPNKLYRMVGCEVEAKVGRSKTVHGTSCWFEAVVRSFAMAKQTTGL